MGGREGGKRDEPTYCRRNNHNAVGVANAVSNCAACQCGPKDWPLATADFSKSAGLNNKEDRMGDEV